MRKNIKEETEMKSGKKWEDSFALFLSLFSRLILLIIIVDSSGEVEMQGKGKNQAEENRAKNRLCNKGIRNAEDRHGTDIQLYFLEQLIQPIIC